MNHPPTRGAPALPAPRRRPLPISADGRLWHMAQQRRALDLAALASERCSRDPEEAAALAQTRQAVELALELAGEAGPARLAINIRRLLGQALDRLEWLTRFDRVENADHAQALAIGRRTAGAFEEAA